MRRLSKDFELLEKRIDRYGEALKSDGYDESLCRDIYGAFYSLSKRYEKEKDNLEKHEREALRKAFEDDNSFTEGLLTIRTIAVHIKQRPRDDDGIKFRTTAGELVHISTDCSAGTVLDSDTVCVQVTRNGQDEYLDLTHSEIFAQARQRIRKALDKCKGDRK